MAKKSNKNLAPHISVIPEVIAEGKDEWGRRYFLFGVGGKRIPNLPPVLASRLDTKRQEVFGELTNAGYGLYTYATKNAFLESLQQWGKKAPSFKVVTKIGWNGTTYVLPDKIFNPRQNVHRLLDELDSNMIAKYRVSKKDSLQDWQQNIG